MRQICADVKSSLNLTPRVDTRLSLKKLEVDQGMLRFLRVLPFSALGGAVLADIWVTSGRGGCEYGEVGLDAGVVYPEASPHEPSQDERVSVGAVGELMPLVALGGFCRCVELERAARFCAFLVHGVSGVNSGEGPLWWPHVRHVDA